MPTYGYECQTCNTKFEVFQRITEDSLKIHEGCGGPLKKLVFPVGIAFKGSGFYVNDYTNAGPKKKPDEAAVADAKPESPEKAAVSETKAALSESVTKAEPAPSAAPVATASTESKPAATAPKAD